MHPKSRPQGLEKNRLEALIDGVFAVALTLLVLDIKLPESSAPMSHDELVKSLLALSRHFVIYVISFVAIGMYWINHHVQFHFVARTTRGLIWINLAIDRLRRTSGNQPGLPSIRGPVKARQ